MILARAGDAHPENNILMRAARRQLPVSAKFDGQKFLTRSAGRLVLTPLFLALIMVEISDLIFAVDSIPAIFGVTRKCVHCLYLEYFCDSGVALPLLCARGRHPSCFRYLKVGLAVVLVFIGAKMVLDPHDQPPRWFQLQIPDLSSLAVVVGIIALAILASLIASTRRTSGARRREPADHEIPLVTRLPPNPCCCAGQLAPALDISPLLAQCLLNRGFSEPAAINSFLEPRLKELADPFLLPNMGSAVERLFAARERQEALVIFGDYDVDGVTATALLLETLRALGWARELLPAAPDG